MTQFNFDSAAVNEKGELCLAVNNKAMARQFVLSAQKGISYTCEIKPFRKKRSLDANAYMWVLCDRLAEATNIPKSEIYRNAIKEIGGVSETYCGIESAMLRLCKSWESTGIGWQTETMPSKLAGCINATLYYGSSTFDTKQMAQLIDNIVQDCESVGIETKTPAELAQLLEEWER